MACTDSASRTTSPGSLGAAWSCNHQKPWYATQSNLKSTAPCFYFSLSTKQRSELWEGILAVVSSCGLYHLLKQLHLLVPINNPFSMPVFGNITFQHRCSSGKSCFLLTNIQSKLSLVTTASYDLNPNKISSPWCGTPCNKLQKHIVNSSAGRGLK